MFHKISSTKIYISLWAGPDLKLIFIDFNLLKDLTQLAGVTIRVNAERRAIPILTRMLCFLWQLRSAM